MFKGILFFIGLTVAFAAQAQEQMILSSQQPALASESDGANINYELGVQFQSTVAGKITAIRFFKSKSEKGSHIGRIFSASGAQLATVTFSAETASGWQRQNLAKPLDIAANSRYTVSVNTGSTYYVATVRGFSKAVQSGNLRVAIGGGVFGAVGRAPASKWENSNYFRDVVFVANGGTQPPPPPPPIADTTAPKVNMVRPSDGQAVLSGAQVAIEASASDNVGVSKVEILVNSAVKCTLTAAPYVCNQTFTSSANTSYDIRARAYDAAGNNALSAIVKLVVNAKAPPPVLAGFPNASNTGIPAGTVLSNYTGSCTITVANTIIDAKTVNCDLTIRTSGVMIKRSKINGFISSGTDKTKNYSFTIEDSEVNANPHEFRSITALGEINFVVRRTHVYNHTRAANCWFNCEITDSYIHGNLIDNSGVNHMSAVRMGENAVIRHNTLVCDSPDIPPDAGCSASLTGYGDFGPVQNNIIDNNYFPVSTGGFCAYGGSSKGKPYTDDANNVRFTNNIFERSAKGRPCGYWGSITDFDPDAPGNVWTNNVWNDGKVMDAYGH